MTYCKDVWVTIIPGQLRSRSFGSACHDSEHPYTLPLPRAKLRVATQAVNQWVGGMTWTSVMVAELCGPSHMFQIQLVTSMSDPWLC